LEIRIINFVFAIHTFPDEVITELGNLYI